MKCIGCAGNRLWIFCGKIQKFAWETEKDHEILQSREWKFLPGFETSVRSVRHSALFIDIKFNNPSFFFDAFTKLRRATISVACFSSRLSVCPSQWKDFHEIWYLNIFIKSVEKIQVSLKSNKNTGYYTCNTHLWSYLPKFFLEQEIFQQIYKEIRIFYVQ